jgi:hypothetical protein
MKGIYLTQEGKQEIEAKIAELEKLALDADKPSFRMGQKVILLEILTSAIILPVEESWQETIRKPLENFQVEDKDSTLEGNYPNGVIIKQN